MLGGLYTAVQYASGRFLIPTLAPIIYNTGIILGGLVGTGDDRTATGFIAGAVIGAFLGNFVLQWWGARATGLVSHGGPLSFSDVQFREYVRLAIPLMVGQSIVVLDESLGSIFAALADPGSIYSLNLARRVNMLPVGVIAQAAGVAAYPFLARLVAERRTDEMRQTMARTMRSVIFVSGLAVAVVVAVSQPLIRVAFQHGEFSASGTVLTAAALIAYAISIPAWGVHQIFARAFYAHRQMWVPVLAGTAWTVLAIPIFMAAFDRYEVVGLAAASSIAVTGYTLTLAALWRRRHSGAGLGTAWLTALRSLAAAGLAGVAGWVAADGVTGARLPTLGEGIAALIVGGLVTVVVYLGSARLLREPELSLLRRS